MALAPSPNPLVVRMSHAASGGEQYATIEQYRTVHYAVGWRSPLDDPLFVGGASTPPQSVAEMVAAQVAARWPGYGRKVGLYFPHDNLTSSDGTLAMGINIYDVGRFDVERAQVFDRISLECTGAVATALARLGIHDSSTDGYPNAVVLDAGTVDMSTTGVKEVIIAPTLTPGRYWTGAAAQVAAATCRGRGGGTHGLGQMAGNNANVTGYRHASAVAGALPAFTATASAIQSVIPKVMLRAGALA